MKKPTTKIAGNSPAKKRAANSNSAMEATFGAYPKPVKAKLLALRRLIFDTAKATEGVGGRDLSRALSGTALWRQPEHSAQRRGKASRSRVAPLRGAGVDVSFTEAEVGEGEIGVTAAHTAFPI